MQKFNRNYNLAIYPKKYLPNASGGVALGNPLNSQVGQIFGELINITYPLTIMFDIHQANISATSFANLKIFNLNQITRNSIYKDWNLSNYIMPIKFDAGYGNDLTTIINGSIIDACSYKLEGSTEIITEINTWDGGEAMTLAYSAIQENSKILKSDLIKKLINNMTAYGVTLGKVSDYGDAAFPKFRSDALAWKTLKQIAGDDLFIDNGKVYCLKAGDLTVADSFLINSESGLLSVPKKGENTLIVEMLFEPKIKINQQVTIESDVSRIYNNTYTVNGIRHTGIISDKVNGKCKTILTLNLSIAQSQQIAAQVLNNA